MVCKMYAENQSEVFRTDPTLVHLSQPIIINFSGCLHGKEAERKQNFAQCCQDKKLPIVSFQLFGNFKLYLLCGSPFNMV